MLNDKTTLADLSMFAAETSGSIFSLIDYAQTQAGRDCLRRHVQAPPASFEELLQLQQVIKFWHTHIEEWPANISNGTIVMLDKFFEDADTVAAPPAGISTMFGGFLQKIFNKNEYFFTQFSLSHIADLLKGCQQLVALKDRYILPAMLQHQLEQMQQDLEHRLTEEIIALSDKTPYREVAELNFKVRREMKGVIQRLMAAYARLDAWHAMAHATRYHNWTFPVLSAAIPLKYEAKGLFHPLLHTPVAYDMQFSSGRNFLLLTGANMSGKTTFMRALGVGALLAHLGMGVPAAEMHISFMRGIVTNMHVEDNLLRGESYFFAEVQRMKLTAERLLQPLPHLVLMDELFKGTNVHDAYECTRAVVDGLLKHTGHIMVLSTHLYEVAQHFSNRPDIQFAHFVTQITDGENYHFTYELKQGISNDRIGYRILQKEGVLKLLGSDSNSI